MQRWNKISNQAKGARGERFVRKQLKGYRLDPHNVQDSGVDVHGYKQDQEVVCEVMNWNRGYVNDHRFFRELNPNLLSYPNAQKIICIAGGHLPAHLKRIAKAEGISIIELPPEQQADQWPAIIRKALAALGVIDTASSSSSCCCSEQRTTASPCFLCDKDLQTLRLNLLADALLEGYKPTALPEEYN